MQTHDCDLYTLHEFHSKIPKYSPCNIRHTILFGIYILRPVLCLDFAPPDKVWSVRSVVSFGEESAICSSVVQCGISHVKFEKKSHVTLFHLRCNIGYDPRQVFFTH